MTQDGDFIVVPYELISDTLVVLQDHWAELGLDGGDERNEDVVEITKRWWTFLDGEDDE